MTRGSFLFKWFWYAMAALLVWLLEDLVFNRFPILGIVPSLLLLSVVAVAVLEGSAGGAGFGLAIGLWWSAALPGTRSWVIVAVTLIGLASGLISQYRLKQSGFGYLLCSILALFSMDLIRLFRNFFLGIPPTAAFLRIMTLELLVTLVFTLPVYLLFYQVYDRVGGTKLS